MGLQKPGQRPNTTTQSTTAKWKNDNEDNSSSFQQTTPYPTMPADYAPYTCHFLQRDQNEMEIFCNDDNKSISNISSHLPFNHSTHTFHCLLDTYDIEGLSANYACKLNDNTNAIDCMMDTNIMIRQLAKPTVTHFKVLLAQAVQEINQQSEISTMSTVLANKSLKCGKQMLICDMNLAASQNVTTKAIKLFKDTPAPTKTHHFSNESNIYEPASDTQTVLDEIFCHMRKEITNMTSMSNDSGDLVSTLDADWLAWPGNNYDTLRDHLNGNGTDDEVWNWNSLFNISTEDVEEMLNGTLKHANASIGLEQHLDYMNVRQHDYDWIFLFVFIFIFAGGLGNILVCLAVALDRKLQNVTNYFLFSLAIADLLVSLFVMPLGAIPAFLGKLSALHYNHIQQSTFKLKYLQWQGNKKLLF